VRIAAMRTGAETIDEIYHSRKEQCRHLQNDDPDANGSHCNSGSFQALADKRTAAGRRS
jgi:hypothetical protein